MVFAAGLGTRLRPITNKTPKALAEINGQPLLSIVLRRLIYFGFTDVIINIHHFPKQIIEYLEKNNFDDLRISISDETSLLLDTGGALKKASWFFGNEPFLVCNVDALTDLNLNLLFESHKKVRALATLAVQSRKTSRYLLFDRENLLQGWKNAKTGEVKMCTPEKDIDTLKPFAFSGIHVISPDIFNYLPDKEVFSIIDVYLEAAKTRNISAFPHDDGFWIDVGTPESLLKAEQLLVSGSLRI